MAARVRGGRHRVLASGASGSKGTDRAIGLFEVAAAALRPDAPEELRGPLDGGGDETVSTPSFPYGCAVCEVEVDPETGAVEIVRYTRSTTSAAPSIR